MTLDVVEPVSFSKVSMVSNNKLSLLQVDDFDFSNENISLKRNVSGGGDKESQPLITSGDSALQLVNDHACSTCNKRYNQRQSLTRHKKTCSGTLSDLSEFNYSCIEPGCIRTFKCVTDLNKHLEVEHEGYVENFTFYTKSEFQTWLDNLCSQTNSSFKHLSGQRERYNTTFKYYGCQFFAPRVRPTPATERRTKKGSVPNTYCPARINVQESDVISVKFYNTHNHDLHFENTKYQQLSKSCRDTITAHLQLGVPANKIQEMFRADVGSRNDRCCFPKKEAFTSNKTISAYARRINESLHLKDDSASVTSYVERLMAEKYDPVLLFKQQGKPTIHGPVEILDMPVHDDLFALGIQTAEQKKMMVEGCQRILCIDSTHKTNQYGFYLLNLIVPDEFGCGYAVAHFITSHLDHKTMCFLFSSLKCKVPDLYVNSIMTDDDKTTASAFKEVFGSNVKDLLCKWHIHRAWQRQLSAKVLCQELRNEIYLQLHMLLEERNEKNFKIMIDKFIELYHAAAPAFIEYFTENYYSRCQLWAMAYRNFPHAYTDTNMYCESFHSKLKVRYFKRKFNRRLDALLDTLLQIENDTYCTHLQKIAYNFPHKDYLPVHNKRHTAGMRIHDDDVQEIDSMTWIVQSQSDEDTFYLVKRQSVDCPHIDHCYWKCLELLCGGLCSHLYTCECPDNAICKHIHKVHSLSMRDKPTRSLLQNNEDSLPVATVTKNKNVFKDVTSEESKLRDSRNWLSDLNTLLGNKIVQKIFLNNIHATLRYLVSACIGFINNEKLNEELTSKMPSEYVAPNKKITPQKIYRTTKNRGAKRKPTLDFNYMTELKKKVMPQETDLPAAHLVDHETSFTPALNYVENVLQPLLNVCGININLFELKSVDPFIDASEVSALKQVSKDFQVGWLFDTIIDAFLKKLVLETDSMVAFCNLTTWLVSGNQIEDWSCEMLSTYNNLFIPVNIDLHWVLIVVKLKDRQFHFYDPLSSSINERHGRIIRMWEVELSRILNISSKWPVLCPAHIKQTDSMNCGVFVCYFAYAVLNDLQLTAPVDITQFRKFIYDALSGNCLKNNVYSLTEDADKCHICSQKHEVPNVEN